jgi:hypothetical protein
MGPVTLRMALAAAIALTLLYGGAAFGVSVALGLVLGLWAQLLFMPVSFGGGVLIGMRLWRHLIEPQL